MKEVWMCQWEVTPGDGEHLDKFPTLDRAKCAMRELIVKNIDLKEYLSDLETNSEAFMERYLTDPSFPRSKSDIPESYEEPEHGELIIDPGFIRWDHPYDAFPRMNGNLVLEDSEHDDYSFDFWYEYPEEATGNGAKGLSIRIYSRIDYGTSAYPLMVLFALREEPATQDQIARRIRETWDTIIDRKAIGRHLELLKALGYPVQHGTDGYYYSGDILVPSADAKWTPSAYPLMVLEVLDVEPQTQNEIVQSVQEKYGIKMDRKAVSRHLELLKAIGFDLLQKSKCGYYLLPDKSKKEIDENE